MKSLEVYKESRRNSCERFFAIEMIRHFNLPFGTKASFTCIIMNRKILGWPGAGDRLFRGLRPQYSRSIQRSQNSDVCLWLKNVNIPALGKKGLTWECIGSRSSRRGSWWVSKTNSPLYNRSFWILCVLIRCISLTVEIYLWLIQGRNNQGHNILWGRGIYSSQKHNLTTIFADWGFPTATSWDLHNENIEQIWKRGR